MKSVLRVTVTQGAVLCPLMKLIEGDPARLCAHMRGLGGSPSHMGVWVAPGLVESLTTVVKEGTGSGGQPPGATPRSGKVGVRTQQAAAILDKCHAVEHGALAEAI